MMSLCRTRNFLLASMLLTCLRVAAQNDRPATDTAAGDTVVVGATEPNADAVKSDTSYSSGADTVSSASGANDSLVARSVPDSVVSAWKNAPGFAYANDPRYWRRMQQQDDSPPSWLIQLLSSAGFRAAIYIILGALLLYAIVRIVTENQLGAFYRGARRSSGSGTAPVDEPATEEDIDLRLQQSIDTGDFPQAVRYSYLRTLRLLDAQGLIRLNGRATNQEYLRQLSGTAQEAPFRFLTYAYEKVFYGQFGLSEETFRRLHGYFTEFDKTLPG